MCLPPKELIVATGLHHSRLPKKVVSVSHEYILVIVVVAEVPLMMSTTEDVVIHLKIMVEVSVMVDKVNTLPSLVVVQELPVGVVYWGKL